MNAFPVVFPAAGGENHETEGPRNAVARQKLLELYQVEARNESSFACFFFRKVSIHFCVPGWENILWLRPAGPERERGTPVS